jgi:eukaryotic-like serine/threonine-protein kinase
MISRSYARLFALAFGIPLLLALLAACWAGTPGAGGATTMRPHTKILLTYQGHTDRATAVAWSPDGKSVASGSLDKTVQVWSAATGKTRLIYRGHTDGILAVGWSPDGRYIASSSLDNTIQVWDASTGAHITTYRGHRLPAQTLSWSPDSREIVSGSLDQTVQVWGVTTGETIHTYRGHSAPVTTVMWSPDGTRIASGSVDKTVQVWDATSGKTLLTFREHTKQVSSLAWSPDSTSIVSGSFDKTVQVWDARTGKVRYSYDGSNIAGARIDNSKGVPQDLIFFVAWSHNGKRIAAVTDQYCGDAVVITWDAQTGKHLVPYPDQVMYALAWSPDDTRFASVIEISDVQITLVP